MEMDRCQLPMLDDTGLEDLKPHTLTAAQNLWQLQGILDRVPPSVIWPTSPSEAQVSIYQSPDVVSTWLQLSSDIICSSFRRTPAGMCCGLSNGALSCRSLLAHIGWGLHRFWGSWPPPELWSWMKLLQRQAWCQSWCSCASHIKATMPCTPPLPVF